jgi:hypothetical protein
MQENVKLGVKRPDAIDDCRKSTGATFRAAAEAYGRLSDEVKLKRGQRAGLRKIER